MKPAASSWVNACSVVPSSVSNGDGDVLYRVVERERAREVVGDGRELERRDAGNAGKLADVERIAPARERAERGRRTLLQLVDRRVLRAVVVDDRPGCRRGTERRVRRVRKRNREVLVALGKRVADDRHVDGLQLRSGRELDIGIDGRVVASGDRGVICGLDVCLHRERRRRSSVNSNRALAVPSLPSATLVSAIDSTGGGSLSVIVIVRVSSGVPSVESRISESVSSGSSALSSIGTNVRSCSSDPAGKNNILGERRKSLLSALPGPWPSVASATTVMSRGLSCCSLTGIVTAPPPSETLIGVPGPITGKSSSKMVPVAVGVAIVTPAGFDNVRVKVSSVSMSVSCIVGTSIVCSVTPGPKPTIWSTAV